MQNDLSNVPDPLTIDVCEAFRMQFSADGAVIYSHPVGIQFEQHHYRAIDDLLLPHRRRDELPTVIIHQPRLFRLILIEVADLSGAINDSRAATFRGRFQQWKGHLALVTAFATRRDYTKKLFDLAWNTAAWFADEPKHLIFFGNDWLKGPYQAPKR